MHWTLYILAAVVGAGALGIWYSNLQERRADRDLAHKQADTDRMNAEAALLKAQAAKLSAETTQYEATTARAKMELDASRQPGLSSKTLDTEHRQDKETELTRRGVDVI
jgi:cell division protein FtsB